MKAVYAGSFSPPTLGHLDIIRRAAALFDEVVVAVLFQKEKKYDFTLEERLDMLRDITRGLDNVTIQADDGLLVDLVHRVGADVIVRGLRGSGDLSQEMQMAEANRQIGSVETVFIASRPAYSMISSTIVRECASHRAPIDSMVPPEVIDRVYNACHGHKAERKA